MNKHIHKEIIKKNMQHHLLIRLMHYIMTHYYHNMLQ